MRAREPDVTGDVESDGVTIHYEVFGTGPTTLLLMGTFPVVDGRQWKAQVPYLARHFRVITVDPRGNGGSGRPRGAASYSDEVNAADAAAVLDATDTAGAFVLALCSGVKWALVLEHAHPGRVLGLVAIAPGVHPLAPNPHPLDPVDDPRWLGDFPGWIEYHSREITPEPHSSKLYDDLLSWTAQTDLETLTARTHAPLRPADEAEALALSASLSCPVLVVHGTDDHCQPLERGRRFAAASHGRLVVLDGVGHLPHGRHPVLVNVLVKEFVDMHTTGEPRPRTWLFARERRRRALWVCSPIGLGHVLRDIAIARSLRDTVRDLEIQWLAQPPVAAVLEAEGEIIHPASPELASESAHWESEASGHDLHAFNAFRRLDEIFCANYMLFDDIVRETPYDLWVGDEAWDVDHFLHENPERKIAPYAFLTDVIGFLPVDAADDPREAELCADYNAEMIEHLARFPYVRDRSVFIGGFDELPDASFGAGLPGIRDWSRKWYTTVPYVVPFNPTAYRRTSALRQRLGYGTGYPLYVAAVGGTAVGLDLLGLDRGGLRDRPQGATKRPDGHGHRPTAAAKRAARGRGHGQARVRPVPVRAPGLRGRRSRAGRPVDDDGTGGGPPPVHLLPARASLGAAALRHPPSRPLPGRPAHGLCQYRTACPRSRAARGREAAAGLPGRTARWREQGSGPPRIHPHSLTPSMCCRHLGHLAKVLRSLR